MRIAIIGKGRVATHLSRTLVHAGHEVTECGGRQRVHEVPENAEFIILSIKDDAIPTVAKEFVDCNCMVVHTSGSVSIDAIPCRHRGVLYPMQTFSMEREVDFRQVPLFLETAMEEDMPLLTHLAASISDVYMYMDGNKRRVMHLAAVLCCNFTNHLYDIAHAMMTKEGIPFEMLLPLIDETTAKIRTISPNEAQTGPAVRWDEKVMERHMHMLKEPLHRDIYRLMSESIRASHSNSK
ncbi:MAG: DUF2520 domain-containing protein [Bacteroides sp.]|nr:DUF2520 domain-containing protein [Bacteroides sp.]MCM1446915.1 DUF2520 domain-containing protein [Bacteroides sp.]MCM1515357.1 DUF2520 domain-containing protein [Paraprevotella sp.]